MGRRVYSDKNFHIYKADEDGYILRNKHKSFDEAHTHLKSFGLCKVAIFCSNNGYFPSRTKSLQNNVWFLTSIVRVCTNKHRHKFEDMLFQLKLNEEAS